MRLQTMMEQDESQHDERATVDEMAREAGRVRVRKRERGGRLSDDWGQPPAEDYCLEPVERAGSEPLVRGKRNNRIWRSLLDHAERWWIERDPEVDVMWVCAVSELSGNVVRYRTHARSSLVRWMRWEWDHKRARGVRFERCTCRERGRECPLCGEVRLGVGERGEE